MLSTCTRGYSLIQLLVAATHKLVPVHTGVFPGSTVAASGDLRCPRAHGSIPQALERDKRIVQLSPHMRGYTGTSKTTGMHELVSPATAGVYLGKAVGRHVV